jgi:hypothetical protein
MSEAAAAGLKALGLRTSEAAAAGFVELGLRMSEAAALGFTASPWPLAPFAMPRTRTAATAREGHPIRIIVCLHSSSFPQRPAARPVPRRRGSFVSCAQRTATYSRNPEPVQRHPFASDRTWLAISCPFSSASSPRSRPARGFSPIERKAHAQEKELAVNPALPNPALPNPAPSFARALFGFAASTTLLSAVMVLLAAL